MSIKSPSIDRKSSLFKCPECSFYKQIKETSNHKSPIFSFKYMESGHSIRDCPKEDKIVLADKLFQLSQMTWQDIFEAYRHGAGQEKIAKNSIRVPIPACVKEDTNLIAIRYNGKAPIIGFRENEVFHVLWVDFDYSVYKHS